tara:strand:- start:8747 stop:9001 length:255 start_codon:yes stop_codon:yes gene_type:complete
MMPLTGAFFLLLKSRRTQMHVTGLNLFTLPEDVDDHAFLRNPGDSLPYDSKLRRPFGEKLKSSPAPLPLPTKPGATSAGGVAHV